MFVKYKVFEKFTQDYVDATLATTRQYDYLAEKFSNLVNQFQKLQLQHDLLVQELGLELKVIPAKPEHTVVHPATPEMYEYTKVREHLPGYDDLMKRKKKPDVKADDKDNK